MDEDHYVTMLEETVRDWFQREYPDDPGLAKRASRVPARPFPAGASLGEACRAAHAYVTLHRTGDSAAPETEGLGESTR